MPDQTKIICSRVDNLPNPVEGSEHGQCATCKTPIWVSPDTLTALGKRENAGRFELTCAGCIQGELTKYHAEEEVGVAAFTEDGETDTVEVTAGAMFRMTELLAPKKRKDGGHG